LRLSSKGAWAGYPSESDLNRTDFGFGLDADYQTSEKTAWNLSGGYDKGYNDASTILTEQGVAFGLVKTEGFDAGIGLTQKVGTNTKLRIDGRFYRVEFDSPAVVDGQNIRGTVVLEKQFSARNSGGLVYSAEQILDGAGNPYLTHYGSLQWTRLFTPRTALLLEGGAGYTPDASDVGLANEYSFYGGLSYVHQVGKSTITALLRREVTPAFGYGQSLLTTRAAVRGAVPLGKDWRFEVIADFVRPDPAALAVLNFPPTTDAAVSLGRRVGRYMALSGATRYRWRGAIGATPGYSAFQIGLMFTASTEGRTVTVPGRPVGAP
jgi:hypothetical protein